MAKYQPKKYKATDPKHVFSKLDECKFFLQLMAENRQRIDTEKQERLPVEFLHYVSAYLSSFRCVAYRLIGVVRHRNLLDGRRVRDELHSYNDIEFVRDISDLEMHGDGVVIWPRYRVELPKIIPERWVRKDERYRGRYNRDRFGRADVAEQGIVKQVVDWRFANRPDNLVDICSRAFVELEEFVQKELGSRSSSGPQPASFPFDGAP